MKKPILIMSAVLVVMLALALYFGASRPVSPVVELSQPEFLAKLQSNLIGQLQISYPARPPRYEQDLRGTLYQNTGGQFVEGNGRRRQARFHASFRISDDLLQQCLNNTNIQVSTVELHPAIQTLKDSFGKN
jgi:hypothetical protein